MPFLELGEVKINYESWDAASPGADGGARITLVNGYTRPLTDFKAMGRYLAERGFQVAALDNRGAGAAECPPVFTLDEMAGDLISLWDHLGSSANHVFGVGLGATVALTAAAQAPGRVRSLVLVAPLASDADFAVESRGPSRDPRRFQAELSRYFSPEFIARERIIVQGFMRQMGKVFQEPDTALGARAQRAALEEFDLRPSLPAITAPTLILQGEADRIVPPATGQAIAQALPKAKLETFPGVGHLLLAEMPVKLYETAAGFFRSVAESSGGQ